MSFVVRQAKGIKLKKQSFDSLDKLDKDESKLFNAIIKLFRKLVVEKYEHHKRFLSFGDYFSDRWDKAQQCRFGEGSSVYDNVLIIGDVSVGKNTWVGPNVVLDGSGKLTIGSNCSISAGVQIYTHDSVQWAVSGGKEAYEYSETVIEDNCYLGPNVIVQKGVTVSRGAIIGANSFVNCDVPAAAKACGSPVRIITSENDV